MATEIGTRIMNRRQQLGWTQGELAHRMGYKTKSAINKIELGVNDVSQSKVIKFAEVLNVPIAYLMGWEEEMETRPVEMAERHFEMIMDEDLNDLFSVWVQLDSKKRKMLKDLAHSWVETKTEA